MEIEIHESSEETAVKGNPPFLERGGKKKLSQWRLPGEWVKALKGRCSNSSLNCQSLDPARSPLSVSPSLRPTDRYHIGQGTSAATKGWRWDCSRALGPSLGSGCFRGPPAYLAFLPRDGVVAAPLADSARPCRLPAPRPRPWTHRAVAAPDIALLWRSSLWSRGAPPG